MKTVHTTVYQKLVVSSSLLLIVFAVGSALTGYDSRVAWLALGGGLLALMAMLVGTLLERRSRTRAIDSTVRYRPRHLVEITSLSIAMIVVAVLDASDIIFAVVLTLAVLVIAVIELLATRHTSNDRT